MTNQGVVIYITGNKKEGFTITEFKGKVTSFKAKHKLWFRKNSLDIVIKGKEQQPYCVWSDPMSLTLKELMVKKMNDKVLTPEGNFIDWEDNVVNQIKEGKICKKESALKERKTI